jgi:alcohol dehydrogenase
VRIVQVRAVVYDDFEAVPEIRQVPDPTAPPGGAVIQVAATGLCRSDWHGWKGHEPDIRPPHVPGHEFAGTVAAVGAGVTGWRPGDRVTTPFACACGTCPACLAGDHQICADQTQPGFTHWGSYAEFVVVHHADVNLVRLPDRLGFPAAAALGCRFATAFRAVVSVGRVRPGEWLAVYGCGGVGLSAVMVGIAAGAQVIAVDVNPAALELAHRLGASVCVDATDVDPSDRSGSGASDRRARPGPVAGAVQDATGGVHVSIDALGSPDTCVASIESLRRRGRHVQVGLLPRRPAVPMDRVIGSELAVLGSHGMPAHAYPEMLDLVVAGRLRPDLLVTESLRLEDAPVALSTMDGAGPGGVRLIEL